MPRQHRGDITAVVDGAYGSCGKGVVVNHLAKKYAVHVRVGSVQAGHSHFHADTVFKQQVVPVGWINPKAQLIIGRGALVSFSQLVKEVEEILPYDPSILKRLKIDSRAGVLDDRHHMEEGGTGGDMHKRIGSTGEGVGAARMARIRRDSSFFNLAYQSAELYGGALWSASDLLMDNVHHLILGARERGENTLLEGAQGAGLSLIHGPWPYVTSTDTNASQMAADIGLPPRFINRTVLVVRSHPIRVAGNSGPLKNEITWAELSKRLGKEVEEKTTVTRKIRRIGEWDDDLFMAAVRINAPTSIALMFADYINPADEGKTRFGDLSVKTKSFVKYLESMSGVPVSLIGTGGHGWKIVDRGIRL
jgi:adenylosuccinate synthase